MLAYNLNNSPSRRRRRVYSNILDIRTITSMMQKWHPRDDKQLRHHPHTSGVAVTHRVYRTNKYLPTYLPIPVGTGT